MRLSDHRKTGMLQLTSVEKDQNQLSNINTELYQVYGEFCK